MKRTINVLTVCALAIVVLNGCSIYQARFSPPIKQETNVVLRENDFHLVERNLEGEYGYLGLHLGYYPFAALEIPLKDPRLFSNALADLYSNSQSLAEGRPSQMVYWTLDQHAWFLPIPYITPVWKNTKFRADLMEYTK